MNLYSLIESFCSGKVDMIDESGKSLLPIIGRRQFLSRSGMGMGSLALAGLLSDQSRAEDQLLNSARTHFEGTAQHVIQIH